MPVVKSEFPILEYDTEELGIIRPNRLGLSELPSRCVMTFFGEVLKDFTDKNGAVAISQYKSEMGVFPVYSMIYKGVEICCVQAVVGSASIAMMTDYLIGYGVRNIITCGACGVLDNIPAGDVIVPVSALRDEGASYHYLPPTREIELDGDVVEVITKTLERYETPYTKCKTWTTDAFYRETRDMVAYRKEEGCSVVEMECATITAIARFRGVRFGQLLYSGDILTDANNYDERNWSKNLTAREKLFFLALEVIAEL